MRLFIAILFPEEITQYIQGVQEELRAQSKQGNFIEMSNMHLTVIFLGEMEATRLNHVKEAMRKITVPSFSVLIQDIQSFKTQEGRLYYLSVKKNDQLETIVEELNDALSKFGFDISDREYKPHITLAREVLLLDDSISLKSELVQPKRMDVEKISLMRSDRIDGKVVYKEIASKHLP